jgi:two-component system NtrC family sensor kinase
MPELTSDEPHLPPERGAEQDGPRRNSLQRELLVPLSVLFSVGLLFAAAAVLLAGPLLLSSVSTAVFITMILFGDLAVIFFFGHRVLQGTVLDPVSEMVEGAHRIANGDFRTRLGETETQELHALSASVNAMADRLIEDQALLSENVRSLDETNRELVETWDKVVRSARLASVGTLSAGLAHEIGNPLGAARGFIDVAKLRLQAPDADAAEVIEILEMARSEALRIDTIVRSLLEFSRPSKGQAGPFDPFTVIARVRELLDAQGKLDRAQVSWPEEAPPLQMVGDPQHLEQILLNLILNALDALEGTTGPEIQIRLEVQDQTRPPGWGRRESDPPGIDYSHRRRVSDRKGERPELEGALQILVLSILDNGPGIPEDHLETLFDPFFTTKDPGKGTGLGLAICTRLVEGMGGALMASNRPEGGATFTLSLPLESG